MKVKCIDNKTLEKYLTINKIYPVIYVTYFLRIDDKLNRLKNLLLNNTNAEVNESVEDTLKDIVGYTLLMLKEIKGNNKKGFTL